MAGMLRAEDATTQSSPEPGFQTNGYFRFTFYPQHNEYDPNIGVPYPQIKRYTARYSFSTDITLEHPATPIFGEIRAFLLLGDNLPEQDYNYSADGILLNLEPTIGWRFNPYLDMRLTYADNIDLGKFVSHELVDPWLALTVRARTDDPISLGRFANLSGHVDLSIYAPGFEYPASSNQTPPHEPFPDYLMNRLVRARYGVAFDARLRAKQKYFDRFFLLAAPRFFFGYATADNHGQWGMNPLTMYLEYGAGAIFSRHLQMRVLQAIWVDLGGAFPDRFEELRWLGISIHYVW